jgi:hypothetical protein
MGEIRHLPQKVRCKYIQPPGYSIGLIIGQLANSDVLAYLAMTFRATAIQHLRHNPMGGKPKCVYITYKGDGIEMKDADSVDTTTDRPWAIVAVSVAHREVHVQ